MATGSRNPTPERHSSRTPSHDDTTTPFIVGLVFSIVGIARSPKPIGPAIVGEKLLVWHVFFVVGVACFVNFIFHFFFGEMAAKFIGWADSPFQLLPFFGFALLWFAKRYPR